MRKRKREEPEKGSEMLQSIICCVNTQGEVEVTMAVTREMCALGYGVLLNESSEQYITPEGYTLTVLVWKGNILLFISTRHGEFRPDGQLKGSEGCQNKLQ